MSRTALDALMGRLLFDGVEAELLGGLNFAGFTVAVADGYYTVTAPDTVNMVGVESINGATVVAPKQGTAVTTTATVNVSGGNDYDVSSAGGAYSLTVGTSGSPYTGEIISLKCPTALANAVTVVNGGAGGGNIGPSGGTIPAGFKGVVDVQFDGTDWARVGVKRAP